jgi:hypothetical protein
VTAERNIALPPPEHRHYFRGQVKPRIGLILIRPRVAFAVLVGVVVALDGRHLAIRSVPVAELATAGLAFAALSFGACVVGAVLALTLPAMDAQRWAATRRETGDHSSYSDLIFVFTWSALAQLTIVLMCALGFVFGGEQQAVPPHPWGVDQLWLGAATTVFLYALTQLFTVLTTISQIGFALIAGWAQH